MVMLQDVLQSSQNPYFSPAGEAQNFCDSYQHELSNLAVILLQSHIGHTGRAFPQSSGLEKSRVKGAVYRPILGCVPDWPENQKF